MASTYTPLGIELMATGENAGTWGTKTNTNLQIFEQIAGGYASVTVNGTGATALSISDGATGANGAARVIILTGTITGNITVTLPLDVENFYAIKNATTGSFTVEFKYVTGTGTSFTWSATQKDWRLFTAKADDATNPNIEEISLTTAPAGSDTQIQFNNSGSFGGSANLTWDGTNVLIDAEGALRLGDNAGNAYVGLQAPTTITSDTAYTLKLPVATGAADTFIKTDGSGNLSFAAISGGAAWQAVITADPANAVAGNGYFCNTTSGAFTVTLPTSATIGDFISFIDYAGTFDTNNLTIGRNGHNIQGAAADLTVAVERAGFTLVYVDATQGWLLKDN
jgi:hypothetical protein